MLGAAELTGYLLDKRFDYEPRRLRSFRRLCVPGGGESWHRLCCRTTFVHSGEERFGALELPIDASAEGFLE